MTNERSLAIDLAQEYFKLFGADGDTGRIVKRFIDEVQKIQAENSALKAALDICREAIVDHQIVNIECYKQCMCFAVKNALKNLDKTKNDTP